MIFLVFKNLFRIFYFSVLMIISLLLFYVLAGHKYYSVLEHYQDEIVSNIKSQYNVNIYYTNIDEKWKYFIPSIHFNQLIIEDKKQNIFQLEQASFRIDLIASILERKVKIKKIDINRADIIYSSLSTLKNDDIEQESNINVLDKIEAELINIDSINIDYTIDTTKNYKILNLSFNYKRENDYISLNYNNIKIKHYFKSNKQIMSKTTMSGSVLDIVSSLKTLGFEKNLIDSGYDKIYTVDGKLDVDIVINSDEKKSYEVNLYFNKNIVKLLSNNFLFKDFTGIITYNSNKGLYSNLMTCKFNNKKCNFKIEPTKTGIDYSFEAYADTDVVHYYTPFISKDYFKGSTLIKGVYKDLKDKSDKLMITSNLKGMDIKVPEFSKRLEDDLKLELNYYFGKNEHLELSIGNNNVFVTMNKQFDTQIYFNKNSEYKYIKGINIFGSTKNTNIKEVLSFISNLNFHNSRNKNNKSNQNNTKYNLDVVLNNPIFYGLSPDKALVQNDGDNLQIYIDDKNISGMAIYNVNKKYLELQLEKLYYRNKTNSNSNSTNETIQKFEFDDIPNIKADIRNIDINGYKGFLIFNGKKENKEYIVKNIQGNINNIFPKFYLKFSNQDNRIKTELISSNEDNHLIHFNDIGNILSDYGYSNTLTSKEGFVSGVLSWSGVFPNYSTLNGNIAFQLTNGTLNAAEASTRVLKIFKILEIDNLSRLLTLNFDFFKKGTKYETLKGRGIFINGIFDINKTISMKSNNYNAILKGSIDFNQESFNNSLKVNLPVTQKLPAIALVSGGPAAAGIVWLADKLVGDKINSLYSLNFKINGTFDNPKISF